MWAKFNEKLGMLRQKLSALTELCPHAGAGRDCEGCALHPPKHCNRAISDIHEDLMSYMVTHFRHEERLMRESGLYRRSREACEAHMQDHGDLSEAAMQLMARLDDGKLPAEIAALSDLLEQWLGKHITVHDRPMLERLDEP
ncbi:MAG: hemerythrin domain-containing protein [Rhodocyclaceae bacterium]|nr:hemerythrin domain-containing protein [Rhodocyclaceae bacterium]